MNVKSPLKKESLSDQIFEILKSMIQNGEWKNGDKLPSELELSKQFSVNRLTVRMALQKLSAFGLVETKAGEGTYVKKFSFKQYIEEVASLYVTKEMIEDVCEFRKLLEIECARVAIEIYDQKDISELEEEYRTFCKNRLNFESEESIEKFIEADLNFHAQIVKMSKNTLYILAFNTAREALKQYLIMIISKRTEVFTQRGKLDEFGDYVASKGGVDLHKTILQSIKNKDFETCKKVYLDMIDFNVQDPLENSENDN